MRFYADFFNIQEFPDLSIAFPRNNQGENLSFSGRQILGTPISQSVVCRLWQEDRTLLDPVQSTKDRFVGSSLHQIPFRSRL